MTNELNLLVNHFTSNQLACFAGPAYQESNEPSTRVIVEENLLEKIAAEQPQQSACAWIGKRALAALPWLGFFSSNRDSWADQNNLELSHEHIWFDDTNSNIGFRPGGYYSEDIEKLNYQTDGNCYDPSRIRLALKNISDLGTGTYNIFRNNCQDFTARVKRLY